MCAFKTGNTRFFQKKIFSIFRFSQRYSGSHVRQAFRVDLWCWQCHCHCRRQICRIHWYFPFFEHVWCWWCVCVAGVAFQIQDDILNLVGEKFADLKGWLGARTSVLLWRWLACACLMHAGLGEDIHEGKRTLMVLHAFANAPAEKVLAVNDWQPAKHVVCTGCSFERNFEFSSGRSNHYQRSYWYY